MSSSSSLPPSKCTGITQFTNCRLARGDELVADEDIWFSSVTGTILSSQDTFFGAGALPDRVVDLQGRIVSAGMIDVQLNGAFGFNFSTWPRGEDDDDDDDENATKQYAKTFGEVNKKLVGTGVTSYLPTLTSQKPELYQKVLPLLGPKESPHARDGAESLGAHCEGPFLSPTKNGIHDVNVLVEAETMEDVEACYGVKNLGATTPAVKKITIAPERGNMTQLIPRLRDRGIICSLGHSEATYEQASEAVARGATMITHLFNAMRPLHHRNPGIFGILGTTNHASGNQHNKQQPPYFGIIADGIHLHPTAIKIAFNAHPDGFILVTDSMHLVGLPDGSYPWLNGETRSSIVKKGPTLLLEGTDKIAGSSITLIECVNNFLAWSGASIPQALKAVTATPAAMLELQAKKGCLDPGADADLVVFSEVTGTTTTLGAPQLIVDEVWKFGVLVYERPGANIPEPTSPFGPKEKR